MRPPRVGAAKERADEFGVAAVVVIDGGGTLKALVRMDGAALLPVWIAQQKAWSAIVFGIRPGVPFVVGGVGVSGGSPDHDQEIAEVVSRCLDNL